MRCWALVTACAAALAPAGAQAGLCSPSETWREQSTRFFSMLDDTYVITGIPSDRKTSTNQVKFQISFKFDLVPNEGPCGLYLAYSQRSLWNAYSVSSPFADTNYNPAVFVSFGHRDLGSLPALPPPHRLSFLWARFGVEHESNGKDGKSSRGWNRVFASTELLARWGGDDFLYLSLQPKIWWPFPDPATPRLASYIGYGELTTELGWHDLRTPGRWHDVSVGALIRKGTEDWKGSITATLRYRPPWAASISLYAQAFFGYDETLIHYDSRTTVYRFGIAFDDRFGSLAPSGGAPDRVGIH